MEDMTKLISLVGGLLAFAGGVLAFLNGRLNEATTPEHRERVWSYASISVYVICPIAGFISLLYFKFPVGILFYLVLTLIGPILASIAFVRSDAPVSRGGVLGAAALMANIVLIYALATTVSITTILSDEQNKMKETISKLRDEVESLGKVLKEKVQPDLKPESTRRK
jgi:hypothetical protein